MRKGPLQNDPDRRDQESDDLATWMRAQLDERKNEIEALMRLGEISPRLGRELLAEVDAKRRILDEHDRVLLRKGQGADYYVTAWVCKTCGGLDSVFSDGTLAPGRAARYPCATVRLLALPYADRPGHREEWKP